MIRKTTAFLGITLLILAFGVLSTSTIFAGGATKHTAVVIDHTNDFVDGVHQKIPANHDVVEGAVVTMVVTKDQLTIQVRTTDLRPNKVISVWGNHADLNGGKSYNLAGGMSGGNGSGNFTGSTKVPSGFDPDGFKVILQDHGDPIPGLVDEQKSTPKAGCGVGEPNEDDCILPVQTTTFVIP